MCWRAWNRMLVTSFALVAAGFLTCAAALLDSHFPHESAWAFLAVKGALATTVILVVIGFMWLCDKCEDYLRGRVDRLFSMRRPSPPEGTCHDENKGTYSPRKADHGDSSRPMPQASVSARFYVGSLRDRASLEADSPRTVLAGRVWRGQ